VKIKGGAERNHSAAPIGFRNELLMEGRFGEHIFNFLRRDKSNPFHFKYYMVNIIYDTK
jgi:hypothetical protein